MLVNIGGGQSGNPWGVDPFRVCPLFKFKEGTLWGRGNLRVSGGAHWGKIFLKVPLVNGGRFFYRILWGTSGEKSVFIKKVCPMFWGVFGEQKNPRGEKIF